MAKRATRSRQRAEQKGKWAEEFAILRYRLCGYRILHQRWRSPYGEIDIIARRGQSLVFVEVKFRSLASGFDTALPPAQIRRLVRAATLYQSQYQNLAQTVRFDVAFIRPRALPKIHKNAIQLSDNDIYEGL